MPSICIDGNEAAARVAYALSESVAIYPITPASPMGELADDWAARGLPNLWGAVPAVVELQSEAGAAATLHGAVQSGSLGTTFTASQGLLLMVPNMFKIAGELTPTVIHVAARTVATHALSIFGDHSDVMACRSTGWTMLASNTPQEAQDLAAVAHAATLSSRVPVLHFFDGFRTSHEINVVEPLTDDDLRAIIDEEMILDHRARGLSPDRPVLRGSAQNPDVFFQAREACNPFYDAVPAAVQAAMDTLGERTGRRYQLLEYHGHPEAERVVVLMGSGAQTAIETVEHLVDSGEKVGVVVVRLFRPFPREALLATLPASANRIAVLDRTKEPGAAGEPLLQELLTVLSDAAMVGERALPDVIGGRYGLSSKEFTPAMVLRVFDELAATTPKRRFTVGIVDDVSHLSLDHDPSRVLPRADGDLAAVFYGLGADGTVGANKNTVKIVSKSTDLQTQGYFVYDSKKSGATTVSHLRFSNDAIRSSYLVEQADLVAVHQFGLIEKLNVLELAKPGGTLLINSPIPAEELFDRLPADVQQRIIDLDLEVHAVDAYAIARSAGLGGRINTVMQTAFFAVTDLLPFDDAVEAMAQAIRDTYGGEHGTTVVERNLEAVSAAREGLQRIEVPGAVTAMSARTPLIDRALELRSVSSEDVPAFVERVTARIMAGEGDLLPVSALPVDGTFPTSTGRWEKRSIAQEIPIWDPDICISCGKCAIVCPHAAIQIKVFEPDALDDAPDAFLSRPFKDRDLTDHLITVQVAPDDCTGCGVCVESCPAVSKEAVGHKAIDMEPSAEHLEQERDRFRFFESIPYLDRADVRNDTVKHTQTLQPLFEFSGACAGCGETPYIKLMTQLFGDRTVIANATGCSSIYGGNLPTTPYGTNADGRGPAWANSLFEDNAEFGLGIRVGMDETRAVALHLLAQLAGEVGDDLVSGLLGAVQDDEAGIAAQRARVAELKQRLAGVNGGNAGAARHLIAIADTLVRRNVWIVGGDGWAYDIGFGGLDHVLASGADVNILVLDTEVYSNTGGQASKSTPRAAVAKFAMSGKPTPKKDLGLFAMQYGTVYVAQIALGANDRQTIRAMREAEAWPGPSLLLAYSTCIAHGVNMRFSMDRMDLAVKTGYWPLFRYHPGTEADERPFKLDSKAPSVRLERLMESEGRFAMLSRKDPERANVLREMAQRDIDEKWRYYEQLAGIERTQPEKLDTTNNDQWEA